MAEFVNDTFATGSNVDLTAHTGETGATWTVIPSHPTCGVSALSNSCYSKFSGSNGCYASGTPASANYEVEADITVVGSSKPGVVGRCSTSTETFYLARNDGGTLQLYRCVSGSYRLISSTSVSGTGTIKLVMDGITIEVWYDGIKEIDTTDSNISDAGKAGLRFVGSDTTSRIDNFTATDISSGSTILPTNCSDGFAISEAVSKAATFSSAATESISLADSDQNIGNLIAAIADQIAMATATTRTVTRQGVAEEILNLSGTVSALGNLLALASDDVQISILAAVQASFQGSSTDTVQTTSTPSARADLTARSMDSAQFSESLISTLQATAVISEIINLSDLATTEALSLISAMADDVFNVSDGATVRADLISAILESFELSDGAIGYLTGLVSASETVSFSDSAFWQGIQAAFVTENIEINSQAGAILQALASVSENIDINDAPTWESIKLAFASANISMSDQAVVFLTALAAVSESIQMDDSGSVTATFDLTVNDAVQFAEAISSIAILRASIADGINVTATAMELSSLPNGKVSVSFSLKVPGVEYDIKTATIIFNIK